MSQKNKVKGNKTVNPLPLNQQGKYRWSFSYRDGKTIDKYNGDGSKNVYADRDASGKPKVHVDLNDVETAGLVDDRGNIATVLEVPEGAKPFQRRRVIEINYNNRFHNMTVIAPEVVLAGKYYPERKVVKRFPEYFNNEVYYNEVWLIGWRRREADNSITVRFKAVYPDGKVDEHNGWTEKAWLYEPEWYTDEAV